MKNCTCGVKFTGGLHSSWCDTLAPDEPEPPTLPSPWHGYDLDAQFLSNFAGRLVRPSTTSLQPPIKPVPKATQYGDGTNALDKICVCGEYIVRDGVTHHVAAGGCHGTRACAPASGGLILAPPKP